MSLCRQQGFIEAPVAIVWELVSDVERHPEWWPRVVEVECDGLEEGCTYRQVTQTPLGKDEFNLFVDDLEEMRRLNIRCLNTGTVVRFGLTEAQGGTFVDGEMGMDPQNMKARVIDATMGRRFFASWMGQTLEALQGAARERAGQASGEMGDRGLEPRTSSLSETRSNQLS